jgi:tetratricopeptide (TPR) repeat protein
MFFRRIFSGCLFLLAAGLSSTGSADQTTAFTDPPEQLLERVRDAGVQDEFAWYLHLGDSYTLELDGRRHARRHEIYVLENPEEGSGWDRVEATWNPGHQSRPEIRARVITTDGSEHWLDPDTLSEQPIGSALPDVFSDRRRIAAPLPFVKPGAIIEVEVISTAISPWFSGGVANRQSIPRFNTVVDRQIVYRTHEDLPFRWKYIRGQAKEPEVTRDGEWTTYEFEFGRIESAEIGSLISTDPDDGSLMLLTSSGESWATVAEAYERIVEEALEGYEVTEEIREMVDAELSEEQVVQSVAAHVRSTIRYSGLHFGDAGLTPYRPDQVDQRGFGDCKDQATYLVAALRAGGIDAHLAVLLTGPDLPVDPEMPGLGVFDHAIVHVSGERDWWIDPTNDRAPALEVPPAAQGRRALVISTETTGLSKIPGSTADQNRNHETRLIQLPEYGYPSVTEHTRPTGFDAAYFRDQYLTYGAEAYKESVREYAKTHYSTQSQPKVQLSGFDDPDSELVLTIDVDSAAIGYADLASAVLFLPSYPVFSEIDIQGREAGEPMQFKVPFVNSVSYRIEYPINFELTGSLTPASATFGPASFEVAFSQSSPGSIEVAAFCRVDSTNISAEDADAIADWLGNSEYSSTIDLYFENPGESALDAGKYQAAYDAFKREIARDPKSPIAFARLSRLYLELGLWRAALDHAEQAVSNDDESAVAQIAIGNVYSRDLLCREYRPGFDRDRAIEHFLRATELDSTNTDARGVLSDLLALGDHGQLGGANADLPAAFRELMVLRRQLDAPGLDVIALGYLTRMGRHDEVGAWAERDDVTPENALIARLLYAQLTGEDAARVAGTRQSDATVQTALGSAATILLQCRYYPESAGLFQLVAQRVTQPTQRQTLNQLTSMLNQARPIDQMIEENPDSPHTPLLRGMAILQLDEVPDDYLDLISINDGTFTQEDETSLGAAVQEMRNMGSQATYGILDDIRPLLDIGAASIDWRERGDDDIGWHVEMTGLGEPTGVSGWSVLTENGYRLAGIDVPTGIAWKALELLDDGHARRVPELLDIAERELREHAGPGPWRGSFFCEFWAQQKNSVDPDLEASSWALASIGSSRKAHDRTERLLERMEDVDLRRAGYADLTFATYAMDERKRHMKYARSLAEVAEAGSKYMLIAIGFLIQGGDTDVARAFLEEQRAAEPERYDWMRLAADLYAIEGRFEEAVEAIEEALETGESTEGDVNQLVWYAIADGKLDATQIERLESEWSEDPGILHTLATAHAFMGNVDSARQVSLHALNLNEAEGLEPDFLLVSARIAQALGEFKIARDAYDLVIEVAEEPYGVEESPSLALRWREELR